MKVTYKGKKYELKRTFRAMMLYENIANESYNMGNLNSVINMFYSMLVAAAYKQNDTIDYDEFIDWLDENEKYYQAFVDYINKLNKDQEMKSPNRKQDNDNTQELPNL